MLLAAALVLELARESLTGTHCRYRVHEQGLPTDEFIVMECGGNAAALQSRREAPRSNLRWLDGRIVRREIVEEAPHQPWQYDRDAETGELLRRTPLFFRAKPARVFDPNPVAALNDPTLQDLNDSPAHIPPRAYRDVELPDAALNGPWARLAGAPAGPLLFDRGDDGFEDVNAYFHIHRNQEWLHSLGYTGSRAVAPYAIAVDAHAGGDDNSFFVPSGTETGRGALFYGEGGTDDAEDADLVVHEYAHALMEWISPGTFAGTFASEARALSEGIADYWAFSAHDDARRASGRDRFCFADWDARCWLDAPSERCAYAPGTDCLRRLDSPLTMADYVRTDSSGVEHRNGAIWSSALREIRTQLPRAAADTIVIEALFGTPARPTFADMARRMIAADRLLYGGSHQNAICAAMRARRILGDCEVAPRGEVTRFQSLQRGIPIPDFPHAGVTSTIVIDDRRAVTSIRVRVDIAHAARGDLRIELVAPDGTVILLAAPSSSLAPDVRVTYGLTATPAEPLDALRGRVAAGTWTLRVSDRRPRDSGTLLSWALDIVFEGDEPETTRPRLGRAQMIPVVTHVHGQAGLWASDVRISNPSAAAAAATLVFTRSGENGIERFAAVDVSLAPRQTVAFDDIVESLFHTAGSGSLEILGDVVVMSRTYVRTASGTLGQQVPANLETTSLGEGALQVSPFPDPNARYNLGITETAGVGGVVAAGGRAIAIEPFGHVQFPVPAGLHDVRVISGGARVVAYVSQLANGDAMFIPAQRDGLRIGIAPVMTAQTSALPPWRSDLWVNSGSSVSVSVSLAGGGSSSLQSPAFVEDVLARLFHRTVTAGAIVVAGPAFAGTRIVHAGTMQFVPLMPLQGPDAQQLVFIESGAAYRTNIGIVARDPAVAEVVVFDASGAQLERQTLSTSGGIAQTRVNVPVTNGRAEVRFVAGGGQAWASLIDNGTGDATFVAGQ